MDATLKVSSCTNGITQSYLHVTQKVMDTYIHMELAEFPLIKVNY